MKSKILDIQINEKNFKILLIIGLGIIILCCMAIYLEIGTLVNYNISDNIKLDNNKDIEYYIEQVVTGRKYIQISGWAYKKNKNINYFNNKFIIQNQDTQEYKSLHTQMNYIEEFNLINDKYDCKRAGMFAKSIAVNLKKGLYKIFIEYKNDGENILVDTGIFFNN